MIVRPTVMPGVLVVEPRVHVDPRGWFVETWNDQRYVQAGLPQFAAQDNLSFSIHGVLRGLHFQHTRPQAKLVAVLEGEIFDVAVDVRPESPTFGRWVSVVLSSENGKQLYVPEGFAHGFCVLSKRALVSYKCNAPYAPECEAGVRWDDPDLGIPWPIERPLLSDKDARWPRLHESPAIRPSSSSPRVRKAA